MNKYYYIFLFGLFLLGSCDIEEQVDPNAPSLNSVGADASIVELNLLVNGIQSSMRNGFGTYVTSAGSIGREFYKFDADPRNTEDLLGKEGATLDNNTFYLTAPYNSRYRCIKNANTLLEAIANTDAPTSNEKNGYSGYAKTIQALMYWQVLNMLNDNGIRFDVSDPENLGPFISKSEAQSAILNLLDEANSELSNASFAFTLSSGFEGFDTPAAFQSFNRALAARFANSFGQYSNALSLLSGSFYNPTGDLDLGANMTFSTASGDITNPIFKQAGQSGDQLVVHNNVISDIESGDARIAKFRERLEQVSLDGLNGSHETALYASTESSISIIRNEELILINAEANINQGNLDNAIASLNVIRNAHGLSDYSGASTEDALIDEMLYQRRYSFWGEAQRMYDLRRYSRLNSDFVPLDRTGDQIFSQFPIPLAENQ